MLLVSPSSTSALRLRSPFLSSFNGNKPAFNVPTPWISASARHRYSLSRRSIDSARSSTGIFSGDPFGFRSHDLNDVTLDWDDLTNDEDEELDSPWEGAVMYKRNPSLPHLEYCTTLERLGLSKLSTDVSRSRASDMGLRVTKTETEYPEGTPVQISIDVTSKKDELRLDGIVRTVISLYCHRCGDPTAETVFSNFAILLSEQPVDEPNEVNFGTFLGEVKLNSTSSDLEVEEEDADWDEKLHFPPDEKQIDISKLMRDLVHVEMSFNSVCDSSCKGLCNACGTNLNKGACACSAKKKMNSYNPFSSLRNQMNPQN